MKKKFRQLIAMLFTVALLVTTLPAMEVKAFDSLPDEINGCTVIWSDGWGIGDVNGDPKSIRCTHGYGIMSGGATINIEYSDVFEEDGENKDVFNIDEMAAGTYQCANGSHIITLVAKPAPTPKSTAAKAPKCNHDYMWKITKEPTVDEAGVASLICTKCGSVEMQKSVANDMLVYQSFANNLEKQIKIAQPGDTLKLDLKAWHSVPQFLMERIISCGYDVELLYKYKGTKYDITIKNGCGQNLNIPWYGPLLMNSMYAK